MKKMIGCILFVSVMLLSAQPQPPQPLKGGERILWVGNSFSSFFGPVTDVLQAFFKAQGGPSNVYFLDKGKGMGTLEEYYHGVEAAAGTLDTIRHGNWNYVVLQGWEDASFNLAYCTSINDFSWTAKEHPGYIDTFVKYGKLLYDEAHKKGATVLFFAPHFASWNFVTEMTRSRPAYDSLEKVTGAFVVREWWAWDTARQIFPPAKYECASNQGATPSNDFIKIFYSDCGHQNGNGMLMTASVWYTVLTGGKSPVNLHPTYPDGLLSQWDPGKEQVIKTIGYQTGLKILKQQPTTAINNKNFAVNRQSKYKQMVAWQHLLNGRSSAGPTHSFLIVNGRKELKLN